MKTEEIISKLMDQREKLVSRIEQQTNNSCAGSESAFLNIIDKQVINIDVQILELIEMKMGIVDLQTLKKRVEKLEE